MFSKKAKEESPGDELSLVIPKKLPEAPPVTIDELRAAFDDLSGDVGWLMNEIVELKKKAEATRRKVYRDVEKVPFPVEDNGDKKMEPQEALPIMRPGDPPPPGFILQ